MGNRGIQILFLAAAGIVAFAMANLIAALVWP